MSNSTLGSSSPSRSTKSPFSSISPHSSRRSARATGRRHRSAGPATTASERRFGVFPSPAGTASSGAGRSPSPQTLSYNRIIAIFLMFFIIPVLAYTYVQLNSSDLPSLGQAGNWFADPDDPSNRPPLPEPVTGTVVADEPLVDGVAEAVLTVPPPLFEVDASSAVDPRYDPLNQLALKDERLLYITMTPSCLPKAYEEHLLRPPSITFLVGWFRQRCPRPPLEGVEYIELVNTTFTEGRNRLFLHAVRHRKPRVDLTELRPGPDDPHGMVHHQSPWQPAEAPPAGQLLSTRPPSEPYDYYVFVDDDVTMRFCWSHPYFSLPKGPSEWTSHPEHPNRIPGQLSAYADRSLARWAHCSGDQTASATIGTKGQSAAAPGPGEWNCVWRAFHRFLRDWSPAVGGIIRDGVPWRCYMGRDQAHTDSASFIWFDAAVQAIRWDAIGWLLPYNATLDHVSWFISQSLFVVRMGRFGPHALAESGIYFENAQHADYPRTGGSSKEANDEFLRVELEARFVAQKHAGLRYMGDWNFPPRKGHNVSYLTYFWDKKKDF